MRGGITIITVRKNLKILQIILLPLFPSSPFGGQGTGDRSTKILVDDPFNNRDIILKVNKKKERTSISE